MLHLSAFRIIVISLSSAHIVLAHAAPPGSPLPQGGQFVSGQGSIATSGQGLVITQPGSARGVIDWNSFSIGAGHSVTFDNGNGATLNRVTGGSPSAILGSLSATGSVYLINPQGVLVGRSGVISTGGRFVASTLDMPNDAFVNGGTLTLSGSSNAKVVNLGKISSSDGDVFLIARDAVVNAGSVSAPNGTAEFVAGQQVVLYESSSSRQVFVQIASHGTVVDRGVTQAAQINLEAADGNIYALAGSGSRIRATGTATRDGHIWLVADNGHVSQQGTLVAANADGSGGTVDTLASSLTLSNDATVQAGLWNVSTPDFTVDSTTAGAFARSLSAGTSVDATATGTNGTSGDMNVMSGIGWQGPASLSLVAFHDVSVAPGITVKNTGSGNLSLRGDAASIDNGSSVANLGTIDWSGSTGFVRAYYDMNGSYSPGTILTNAAWKAAPYSGLVTQATGYKLINSYMDLRNVALDLAGNYALSRDITPDGLTVNPLGNAATPFSGQFDGMGHVIDGLGGFNTSTNPMAGLFGVIGPTGVVRNVGLTNVDISGQPGIYGALAGQNEGLILYASVTGQVDGGSFEGETVGGLVGRNDGVIERSTSSASMSLGGMLGGLVGINYGTIDQSYTTGSVVPNIHGNAGGLVANNFGTVSDSYSTGVTFGEVSAGGLVYANAGTIVQSFAAGPVEAYCRPPNCTTGVYGGIASSTGGAFDTGDHYIAAPGATIASNVYWDTETTGQRASVGSGTQLPASNGLTTAQMSNPASFDASWDFSPTGTWVIPASATHPVLRWQTTP